VAILNELAKRLPGFKPGKPITLADGQAWHFPKPMLTLFPAIDETAALSFCKSKWLYRDSTDELVDKVFAAETFVDEANALLTLAVRLLCRNYDLDAEALIALLPWSLDDESPDPMWVEIIDLVLGRASKRTASGSGQ
jgi:hypothetical protein